MRKVLFILLTLAIPAFLLAVEPVREWKSKSGKIIIEASLDETKDTDDPDLVYLLKEGKRYKVPFKNLSQADQDYVTEFRKGGRNLDEDVGLELDDDADDRGIEVVPAGNRYALLIGVNRYVKPIKSLKYCVNDMELLADQFQKLGVPKENIFLVTDDSPLELRPTGINIRRQIENVTRIMGRDDQLIVAFSGHGILVGDKSYLCPSDTDLKDKNSIVPRDWVFEQLEKCRAKQKIFIIDACRNELTFAGDRAADGARTLEDPIGADTHGFILLASCDKTQRSWEHPDLKHGVFTYYLAEGLSGAAKDEDGYVSVLNLFQYASSKTKKYVLREYNEVQVPTFRQGDEMTDFCIAKLDQAPKPGDRKVEIVNGVEFAFRWCPAGTFTMGSPEWEEGRYDWEKQHSVTLTKGFWMMETEVTQKQWKAVMGNNPSNFKGDDLPVERVTWNECKEFCEKCTQLGLPVQLPTEAQWEYACRAGSTTAYFWGNALNGDKANCNGNYPCGTTTQGKYLEKTTPVGSYQPNAWGLYDMHGNVLEWCQDLYGDYPSGSVTDPAGPSSGSNRVDRGGGWYDYAGFCRSAIRFGLAPGLRYSYLGFRLVRGQ